MCNPLTTIVSGTVVGSIFQSNRARREERAAQRAQQRIRERQQQRERIAQLRSAQINRASIEASSAATGTGGSSSAQGAAFSQTSQAASNIQFINQVESLQQEIQRRMESASVIRGQIQDGSRLLSALTQATPNSGGS